MGLFFPVMEQYKKIMFQSTNQSMIFDDSWDISHYPIINGLIVPIIS
jgi:hypothetical protein